MFRLTLADEDTLFNLDAKYAEYAEYAKYAKYANYVEHATHVKYAEYADWLEQSTPRSVDRSAFDTIYLLVPNCMVLNCPKIPMLTIWKLNSSLQSPFFLA